VGNDVNGIKLVITTYYPTKIRLTLYMLVEYSWCAKCKRVNWNDLSEDITPIENGLRRRINGFRELYEGDTSHYHIIEVQITSGP
jgi:hypothetical protein